MINEKDMQAAWFLEFLGDIFEAALPATTHLENGFARLRRFADAARRPIGIASLAAFHMLSETLRAWKAVRERLHRKHHVVQRSGRKRMTRPVWSRSKKNSRILKRRARCNTFAFFRKLEREKSGCTGVWTMHSVTSLSARFRQLSKQELVVLRRKAVAHAALKHEARERVFQEWMSGDGPETLDNTLLRGASYCTCPCADGAYPISSSKLAEMSSEQACVTTWSTRFREAVGETAEPVEIPNHPRVMPCSHEFPRCTKFVDDQTATDYADALDSIRTIVAPRKHCLYKDKQLMMLMFADEALTRNTVVLALSTLKTPLSCTFVNCGSAPSQEPPFEVCLKAVTLNGHQTLEFIDEKSLALKIVEEKLTSKYRLSYLCTSMMAMRCSSLDMIDVEQLKEAQQRKNMATAAMNALSLALNPARKAKPTQSGHAQARDTTAVCKRLKRKRGRVQGKASSAQTAHEEMECHLDSNEEGSSAEEWEGAHKESLKQHAKDQGLRLDTAPVPSQNSSSSSSASGPNRSRTPHDGVTVSYVGPSDSPDSIHVWRSALQLAPIGKISFQRDATREYRSVHVSCTHNQANHKKCKLWINMKNLRSVDMLVEWLALCRAGTTTDDHKATWKTLLAAEDARLQ